MKARLCTQDGITVGRIGDSRTLVGRSKRADIKFTADLQCSREHFEILTDAGRFQIVPISPNNPVYVNGQAVGNTIDLQNGDHLKFGNQDLILVVEEPGYDSRSASTSEKYHATIPPHDEVEMRIQDKDQEIILGRAEGRASFVLDHPLVSRRHAVFQGGADAYIRDLGSTNGTFVNGERIGRQKTLVSGDRVDIGPYSFSFDGAGLVRLRNPGNMELAAHGVCLDVMGPDKSPLRILHDASLTLDPHEFVCIVGPSGSGKSTLMKILSGRVVPSSGMVRLGDLNLHQNFESLKQDIAFVPQYDVLHETLSLERALNYTAILRLPQDSSPEYRRQLIQETLEDVNLSDLRHSRLITLSGGQKKRASLASEMLSQPGLTFLDEVTSGLDEATDREIMRTLKSKAESGTTIVCVTHTMANVMDFCDRLVVMANGGYVAFNGTPMEALDYFEVDQLGQIYDRLNPQSGEAWRNKSSDVSQPPPEQSAPSQPRRQILRTIASTARQLAVLVCRDTEIAITDRRGLSMAAIQSLVIGGVIGYAFSDFGAEFQIPQSQSTLFLLLGLCSLWLGCNLSSQEIVKGWNIFEREYDVNLSPLAFVLSKALIATAYTSLQFVILFFLVYLLADDIPGPSGEQLGFLLLGCLVGCCLGLLLSGIARTTDQASLIVPLTLIPQLVFSGVLISVLPKAAEYLSEISISGFWIVQGLQANLIADEGEVLVMDLLAKQPVALEAEPAYIALTMLLTHALVFLIGTYLAVRLRLLR